MRVVFFLQGQRVPAARVRGMAIADRLRRAGLDCDLRIPQPSVYGDTDLPRLLAWPRPLFSLGALPARMRQLTRLRADDIVFFQRPMVELPTVALERRAARGRKSVFDFDDAIYLNRRLGWKVRELVSLVDHVIVGNRTLAEAAGAPDKTTIIPTAIDLERFIPAAPRATRGREVVVGWTGLASNYPQLLTALPGLSRALAQTGARLLLISNAPPPAPLQALGAEYQPWSASTEIESLRRLDIGLMPLPDSPYARGKCAFKLLQYMAMGIPGVASPVGANVEVVTHGCDGFLPATDEAWTDDLVRLIEDPHLRAEVGARGRRRVAEAYSLDAVLPRYLQILHRVATA